MKLQVYVLSALLVISCVRTQDSGDGSNKESYDISQLEYDTQATDALKEGINWIYSQAAEKYGISGLDIDVTKVNKIDKWEDNGDTYYDFDVESENADAYLNSTYSVRCLDGGEYKVVNDWSYNIDRKDDNEEEQSSNYDTNEDTNTYNSDEEDELPDYNTNVELELGEGENENECVEEFNNICEEGSQVDASEINTDDNLRNALSHGITWIFEQANEKFGISKDEITVKKVNSICTWEKDGNTYWHFDVEATNSDDETVKASYNVKLESDTGDFRVVNEWSYVIDYPDDDNNDEEDENKTEEKDGYVDDIPDEDADVYQDDDEEEMDIEVEIDSDVYDTTTDEDNNNDNPYPDNNDDDDGDNPYPDNNDDDTNDNPYPDNNDDDTNDDPYPNNN